MKTLPETFPSSVIFFPNTEVSSSHIAEFWDRKLSQLKPLQSISSIYFLGNEQPDKFS